MSLSLRGLKHVWKTFAFIDRINTVYRVTHFAACLQVGKAEKETLDDWYRKGRLANAWVVFTAGDSTGSSVSAVVPKKKGCCVSEEVTARVTHHVLLC